MRYGGKYYPRVKKGGFIDIDVPLDVRWTALEDEANFIVKRLMNDWQKALNQSRRAEAACHRFLAENAGIFLQRDQQFPVVISKLRLGAEFVTDLVLVENCYSDGAKYHLIELESPSDPLFTQKGVASQPLLAAIHQIISWKSWLQSHHGEARRLLPSFMHNYDCDAVFSYTIVIGRRTEDAGIIKRRRELASSLGINIRSFDSLADGVAGRHFSDTLTPISGDQDPALDDEDISELINPFRCALSDPEWRQLAYRAGDVGHFYSTVGAKYRAMGRHGRYLDVFRQWCKKQKRQSDPKSRALKEAIK